jgi:oligosaccharide repeat unit polymerase
MAIFVSLVCLFFIILITFFDKRIYNPFILFNAWWGITILISSLGLFDIFTPSAKTYSVMLIAILSFNFSVIFMLYTSKKGRVDSKKVKGFEIESKYLLNHNSNFIKLLMFTHSIIFFILVLRSIKAIKLLLSGLSYSAIRYNYFKLDTIMSGYDHIINNLFVIPILTFSMIFVSLQYFQSKYNKIIMFSTIVCIILFVFSSGGRSILITFGIIFITSYLINKKDSYPINLSKKILMQMLLLFILFSLLYVSLRRLETGGGINEVLSTVVRYFSASYLYYENMIVFVKKDEVLLYGMAFFGGIIDFFIFIFRFLGLDINPISSYISEYNQLYITVNSEGAIYNAFPTMIYTFFYDFGYLGIILGPLLFGYLSFIIYNRMILTNDFGYKGIYIMIVILIYESPMRWIGTSPHTWIVIFLFIILVKTNRNKKIKLTNNY